MDLAEKNLAILGGCYIRVSTRGAMVGVPVVV